MANLERPSMAFFVLAISLIVRGAIGQQIVIGGFGFNQNPSSSTPGSGQQVDIGGIDINADPSSPVGLESTSTVPLSPPAPTVVPPAETSKLNEPMTTIASTIPVSIETTKQRMLLPESTSVAANTTEVFNSSSQAMLPETTVLATASTPALESTTVPLSTIKTDEHRPILSDFFHCAKLDAGIYGNPKNSCDTKFFICVDRSMFAYEQICPARLYFDEELKICESWIHIPGCSGKPRPTVLPTKEPNFTLPTAAPVVECFKLADGYYPDPLAQPKPFCSNRFFVCVGKKQFEFRCPRGLYYDHRRNRCDLHARVFDCTGILVNDTEGVTWRPLTLPPVNFDCRNREDGYYVEKCESIYYSCTGGLAREFRCPDDLVFDSEWRSCEAPHDTLICTGNRRPSTVRPSTIRIEPTSPWPLSCRGRPDGIYRDPEVNCSRKFYYCTHDDTVLNICPGNLYYDNEFKRCDLWINIFDCSGIRPTPKVKPITVAPSIRPALDFDCSRLEDGNYVNPKANCSKFFYICANMEAFEQHCPAGLYYSPESLNCESWANIFACSGVTRKPTPVTLSTLHHSTPKPEFDCSLKDDGVYMHDTKACSGVYFRCIAGNTFKFNCPNGLFYDLPLDRCDERDFVFACSGKTRPPLPPSTERPVRPSTEKPPVDCRLLEDGDYADPSVQANCSHHFYTCSSGFAFRRQCADSLYFDAEYKICDAFWHVPACTGSPRPKTVTPPITRRTTGPPLPLDCTKRYDGDYSDPEKECSAIFYSCVGGTTFLRKCPLGFVYDDKVNDPAVTIDKSNGCEYPYLVPKCGGSRITIRPTVHTVATTPVGGFDCAFLADGNYVDPAANDSCSKIYYTCANGLTTRVHCPADLFYDRDVDTCNIKDLVPACGGVRPVLTVTPSVEIRTESLTSTSTMAPTTTTTSTMAPTTTTTSTVPPTTTTTSTVPPTTTTTSTVPPTTASTSTLAPTTSEILIVTTELSTPAVETTVPETTMPSTTETTVPTTTAPAIETTVPTTVPTTSVRVTEAMLVPETTEAATTTTTLGFETITKILLHNYTQIITERVPATKPTQAPLVQNTMSTEPTLLVHVENATVFDINRPR